MAFQQYISHMELMKDNGTPFTVKEFHLQHDSNPDHYLSGPVLNPFALKMAIHSTVLAILRAVELTH